MLFDHLQWYALENQQSPVYVVKGCTVPHWKALTSGKFEPRALICGSTSSICQDVLKLTIYYINRALLILFCKPLYNACVLLNYCVFITLCFDITLSTIRCHLRVFFQKHARWNYAINTRCMKWFHFLANFSKINLREFLLQYRW